MKHYLARYTLRNGARGTLHVLTRSSWDAIDIAIQLFGDSLRRCSALPA